MIIYNSKLAKLLNVYSITIFIFIFTIDDSNNFKDKYRNHEYIHVKQWIELSIIASIFIVFLAYFEFLSYWFTILSFLFFHVIYSLEYVIKFIIICILKKEKLNTIVDIAYYNISFEISAFNNEINNDYKILEWIKYIPKLII